MDGALGVRTCGSKDLDMTLVMRVGGRHPSRSRTGVDRSAGRERPTPACAIENNEDGFVFGIYREPCATFLCARMARTAPGALTGVNMICE